MEETELVGAVVVTFHPGNDDIENLGRLRPQVDLVVVVDNGSTEDELGRLRHATQEYGCALIENHRNLGIGAALNAGVEFLLEADCCWIALFDQDSAITDGFINALVSDFRKYRESQRIMQIIPRHCDPKTGTERPVSRFRDGGVFLTITSGSLFSAEVFSKCGMFNESLFIYGIDDDYSLRIRRSGYYIGKSERAVLFHRSGHPTYRRFLWRKVATQHYRPVVRYYIARNKIWLLRRYGLSFPQIILPTLRQCLTIPIKILLMEGSAGAKLAYFGKGILAGVAGNMGMTEPVK
jgi:rhamnosyltransferase